MSCHGFWGGRINICGTYIGSPVNGLGCVELTNVDVDTTLETFSAAVYMLPTHCPLVRKLAVLKG